MYSCLYIVREVHLHAFVYWQSRIGLYLQLLAVGIHGAPRIPRAVHQAPYIGIVLVNDPLPRHGEQVAGSGGLVGIDLHLRVQGNALLAYTEYQRLLQRLLAVEADGERLVDIHKHLVAATVRDGLAAQLG